ncbi:dynactin subunit 1-like [Camellia sinensis]|uniref:dynactin subunit 1-like n=1 Tax=Camellia sinensis TaxID=4442 RepID=UPI001036CA6A|nr:dynactin subunit 1-like [Camellia sinensis]
MGMWKHRVDTPSKLDHFRCEFDIPVDVHLRLAGDDDSIMPTTNSMPFPAIQHAHSFSVQSFENQEKLAEKKREVSTLQKTNKNSQSKMKSLEDQAEAVIKAQNDAEEKADSAKAIKKVLEAKKKDVEEKTAQVQKELQDTLATKEAEIKAADEKGYNKGVTDVTADYEKQDDEVPKDATPKKASSDVPTADKSIDETLQEIDAKLAAKKVAEMFFQQSSEIQT